MIDNQQTAIFKLNQDFNKNKEKNIPIHQIRRELASYIGHMFLYGDGM